MATQPPSHITNKPTLPRKSAENDEFVLDEQQRILQLLRPIDDEFMRCLFRGQLPLAQQVLRTITGIDDLVLTEEVTQYDLKRLAGS